LLARDQLYTRVKAALSSPIRPERVAALQALKNGTRYLKFPLNTLAGTTGEEGAHGSEGAQIPATVQVKRRETSDLARNLDL